MVDVENTSFWCGKITENQLRRTVGFCLFPDGEYLLHAGIHFTAGFIRQGWINEPLVKGELTPIVRDGKHIVYGGINVTAAHCISPFSQFCDHIPLNVTGFQLYVYGLTAFQRGHRQLEHICGLNIGTFLEHTHKLR